MTKILPKTTSVRRRFALLLSALFLLGAPACSDDAPASVPTFPIGDVSDITFYDISGVRELQLPGTGFEPGDAVCLTDTGLSGHTYTLSPRVETGRLVMRLPDNFIDGVYRITIVRGAARFVYGEAEFCSKTLVEDREGMNLKGKVRDTNGHPIAGAVVSDGISVTRTDEDGCYWLATERKNPHVFVSIPRGYMPVEREGEFTTFFRKIPDAPADGTAAQADFTFHPVDNDDFELVVVTDIHLTAAAAAEAPRLFTEYCIPDINSYIRGIQASGRPAYTLNLGDLVASDKRDLITLEDGVELLKKMDGPIFNVPGNHELYDGNAVDASVEIARYYDVVGPLYYSVNLGRIHLVALNPCVRNIGIHMGTSYALSEEQLEWLRRDLAQVEDKSATLVVAIHTPLFQSVASTEAAYGRYWLPNGADLAACLEGFTDVHVVSGHCHRMYNTVVGNIVEHNYSCLGGTSGHWTTWRLSSVVSDRHQGMNTDGSPASYGTMTFRGKALTDYCVKGVNLPREKRFRTYDRNKIHLVASDHLSPTLAGGSRGAAFNAAMGTYHTASSDNEILVKIWEYDTRWKVEILEDGKPLDWSIKLDKDPLYLFCYDIPSYATLDNPNYGGSARALFSAKAASATSTVTIRVTDSFGRVTEETMTRPKAFVSSYD